MANARSAWGIDIGNRALKAVKLVRDSDDNVRIDDFEFIEHESILSQSGDNRENLIQTALGAFVQRHTFKGTVASIGVAGQNSFARFVKLPPVDEKKIPEIVRFEAIQQIPFPLEEVEWSYQLFRQPENPEVEVGIFAMRKELVNHHIKYFTDYDLNVQNVQMNPLAVYNALQFDGRLNDGTSMVIDVGADNTDLLIASNDSIWMRSIPIGGSNFTETLVKTFKLNFAKAEDLKRNAATSKYARQIFQAMRPVFADLVAEIQRSMGFYSSVHKETKLAKVYALGGTFKLPGLQKYLQQNLQLPVERLDSIQAGAPTDPKAAAVFGDNLLSLFGAYGLALQAMGGTVVNSSLLPQSIQDERMWQDKRKWFATAAAIFLSGPLIAGGAYAVQHMQANTDDTQKARSHSEEIANRAKGLADEWDAVQNSGTSERTIIENLHGLNKNKWLIRDILAEALAQFPEPDPALAKAILSRDKAAIMQTKRNARKLFQVDEWTSEYDPHLGAKLADPKWEVTSSMTFAGSAIPAAANTDPNATAAAPATPARGFIIRMTILSPYHPSENTSADKIIENEVKKKLEAIAPSKNRPTLAYKISHFKILGLNQFKDSTERKAKLMEQYTNYTTLKTQLAGPPEMTGGTMAPGGAIAPPPWLQGGAGGPGMPGGAGPGGAPNNINTLAAAMEDRITGESMDQDWEINIGFVVELDPEPYKAPEAVAAQP